MSRYIKADYLKAIMKNDRLLQGNCEYELWSQQVDKYVDALPSIEVSNRREADDLIRRIDAINVIWAYDVNPSDDGMVFEAQSHIDRDIRLIPPADRKTENSSEKPNNSKEGEPMKIIDEIMPKIKAEARLDKDNQTLWIKADTLDGYDRIIIEDGSNWCRIFYEDCGECAHNKAEQDEPTVSKMEQVDKDINVRSKDEPTTQTETQNSNLTFEKADEPQTERRCGDCKHLTYRFNKTWCDIKCDNPHDVVCDKCVERSE